MQKAFRATRYALQSAGSQAFRQKTSPPLIDTLRLKTGVSYESLEIRGTEKANARRDHSHEVVPLHDLGPLSAVGLTKGLGVEETT